MSGEFQIGSKCWPAYLWSDPGREAFSGRPVSAHSQGEDTEGRFWEKTGSWQLVSKSPAKVRGTELAPVSGGSTAKGRGHSKDKWSRLPSAPAGRGCSRTWLGAGPSDVCPPALSRGRRAPRERQRKENVGEPILPGDQYEQRDLGEKSVSAPQQK